MKLTLAASWSGVTIEQFRLLHKLNEANLEDQIDYDLNLVSICSELPYSEISKLSLNQLRTAVNALEFTKQMPAQKKIEQFVRIDTRIYECKLAIEKVSAGQYIDMKEYIKRGVVDNLHYILTCFYIPVGEKYAQSDVHKIAQEFKDRISIGECYPIAVFFWNLLKHSMEDIQDCLVNQTMEQIRNLLDQEAQTKPSMNIGVGLSG